jgi:hypothetical protein
MPLCLRSPRLLNGEDVEALAYPFVASCLSERNCEEESIEGIAIDRWELIESAKLHQKQKIL